MPKEEIKTEATKLHERLKELRELKGDSRQTFCHNIISFLGYKKDLDMDTVDALLIKAIEKKFGKFNIEADITLMTLGLLDGYSYNVYPTIMKRREQFLKKSTYLIGCSSSGDKKEEDAQKQGLGRLVKNDTQKLQYLAEFLIQYKGKVNELLNGIDNYMNDGIAILPTPSYLKRKPLQDRIRQAIVKFFLLGKRLFAIKSDIAINKNDEYEININLTKEAIAILSNATICMLLCISIPITTTIYTQKYTIVETQETDMEYQTKNDITKTYERANQKLDAKPTTDLLSENDAPVSSF